MFKDPQGPITQFDWGKFTINGEVHSPDQGVGKDIFLSAEGVSAWHEREGHKLKPEMLMRALKRSPEPVATRALFDLLGLVPKALEDLSNELFGRKASLVMTNVAGPREPLYLAGVAIDRILGWAPHPMNVNLKITYLSGGDEEFGPNFGGVGSGQTTIGLRLSPGTYRVRSAISPRGRSERKPASIASSVIASLMGQRWSFLSFHSCSGGCRARPSPESRRAC